MILALLAALAAQAAAPAPKTWPTREADVILKDFRFGDGESLPQLKIHYTTLGQPHRNAAGQIDNAVMVLHGTGGDGKQFLRPQFADELYGPGQPLDIRRYFIILPDNIGHGGSSKPSDGLRMKFPKYDYADMVEAQHRLLTEGLGIRPHAPDHGHVDGLHAQLHVGRDVSELRERADAARLRADRDRRAEPHVAADGRSTGSRRTRRGTAGIMRRSRSRGCEPPNRSCSSPAARRSTSRRLIRPATRPRLSSRRACDRGMKSLDANDMIYQFDSSRNYNPWPNLEKITAPMTWVNSADDFINPRNLDVPQRAVKRMKNARFRLIPESAETHGHGTHTWAKFWKADLSALLARSAK